MPKEKWKEFIRHEITSTGNPVMAMAYALVTQGIPKRLVRPTQKQLKQARIRRSPAPDPITRVDLAAYSTASLWSGERTASSGPKRTHLRRGHVRNQACGPGYSEHKKIWVKPALVNSDGELFDRDEYEVRGAA
jgi:hypothetical protein